MMIEEPIEIPDIVSAFEIMRVRNRFKGLYADEDVVWQAITANMVLEMVLPCRVLRLQ